MGKRILVGILLLGALIIFALGTFYIEDWGLTFQKGYSVGTRFESAEALEEGDNVTIAGVKIGKVKKLDVSSEPGEKLPVKALLWVREEVVIRADDIPEVRTKSIFGGKFIAIVKGDPSARALKDGEMMKDGVSAPDIPEVIASANSAITKAETAIVNLTEISDKMKKGEGTVGKLLMEEGAYDELMAAAGDAKVAFKAVKELVAEVREGKGVLTALLKDEKMAQDFKKVAGDASTIAEDGKALVKDLRTTMSDVREGKGTVGKLFKSDELYEDLKSLAKEASEGIKGLKDVADKVSKGEGAIAKLLNSDEAYKSLMVSLENVKEMTNDFAKGNGTLPKLMRDDKLHKQIELAVKGIQEAIEDMREQSPIVTFTGVVFGAF